MNTGTLRAELRHFASQDLMGLDVRRCPMVNPTKPVVPVVLPETEERSVKVRVPKAPNMSDDGTEFPCLAVLVYADGTRITFPIRKPKPSAATHKINAWAGGKMALEDGTQVQVGINLTILD